MGKELVVIRASIAYVGDTSVGIRLPNSFYLSPPNVGVASAFQPLSSGFSLDRRDAIRKILSGQAQDFSCRLRLE